MLTRPLVALLATATFVVSCERAPRPPNVVVILSDDQGWADIGYHNPAVYTPNLDALASEGVRFDQHYVMPQCTPSRVALLTGRYPGRFGPVALQATNQQVLPEGTATLATVLRSKGYSTHIVGKWHLGSRPESGPNHYGFDESYGLLGGAAGMYDHRYRSGEFEMTWHRNEALIEGSENGVHATDLITAEAVRVIENAQDRPFFLYLAYTAVHTPLDERGPFVDRPTQLDPADSTRWLQEDEIPWFNDPKGLIQSEPDPEKRLLLAAVHHLDSAVGEVIEALERTGQRQNTLILYSSDNGPQVDWPGNAYPDDLRLTDANQPLPMRGIKTDVWEGGIHVPAFAVWPSRLDAKRVQNPVHVVDWLPTLASIVGTPPEELEAPDGVDLSPILFGDGPLPERDLYWIWSQQTDRWALRFGDWKIVRYGREEPNKPADWMLFDLSADPKETTDVASEHPEIVADLHGRFEVQRTRDLRPTGE